MRQPRGVAAFETFSDAGQHSRARHFRASARPRRPRSTRAQRWRPHSVECTSWDPHYFSRDSLRKQARAHFGPRCPRGKQVTQVTLNTASAAQQLAAALQRLEVAFFSACCFAAHLGAEHGPDLKRSGQKYRLIPALLILSQLAVLQLAERQTGHHLGIG